MSTDTLQIFISSPGDVGQERVIAERVIDRLRGEFGGRADIEPVLWEHEPLRATEHFQEQITPPAETDIAVFILWSRLGTPLPEDKFQKESGEQYKSGTEWEFENAVESYRETGTPDLLTYRKTKDPETTLSDEEELQQRIEQKKALEAFIDRWFMGEEGTLKAAFHTFETPDEFERRLEEHLRRLIEEHLPDRATEGTAAAAHWHQGSPFRGLQAFDYEHAPVFFGRTRAVGEVIDALEGQAADGHPFVLVTGPSGSGKSSLVKAGVVPTLTEPGVIEGIGVWSRATVRPSDTPDDLVDGLARALLSDAALPELAADGWDAGDLADLLREAPGQARTPIENALERQAEQHAEAEGLPEPPAARLLLVLDQMEEVFTLDDVDATGRAEWAEAVRALTENGLVWTLGTLRSDFYPRLTELTPLRDLRQGRGQYALDPPEFAELGRMIRKPARAAGLQFEHDPETGDSLDDVLHEAAANEPEALPLLEFTLEELYQRRDEDVLTFDAYEELGGLEGALAERAEEVYQGLPASAQDALPDVMEAIVTIREDEDGGAEGAAASRRVPIDDVTDDEAREALVDAFVEARLLVTDRNDAGEAVVSVAHEALLREWPRLADWIERNRAFLQTRARVQERAARWDEEGRPDDLLLPTGQPLAEARGLLEERAEALGETLRAYVEQSIERAERREQRRRWVVGGVAATFFLVVAGFGLFSYQQWTSAAEQRDQALQFKAQILAQEATRQAQNGDALTGLMLALEGATGIGRRSGQSMLPETQQALYQALAQTSSRWTVSPHSGNILGATLGPSGRYLATNARDSTARLYDLDRRRVTAVLGGHGSPVWLVGFEETGEQVVTTGGTTARVWTVPSGEPVHTLTHQDSVLSASFQPGGDRILTTTKDRSGPFQSRRPQEEYHLWAEDGTKIRTFDPDFEKEDVRITHAGFTPKGSYIVVAYEDTSTAPGVQPAVFLRDADGTNRRAVPLGQNTIAEDPFFFKKLVFAGPNEKWLAIGSSRLALVRLSDLEVEYTKDVTLGHQLTGQALQFGPDGRRMLVATSQGVVLMDVESGEQITKIDESSLITMGRKGERFALFHAGTLQLRSAESGEKLTSLSVEGRALKSIHLRPSAGEAVGVTPQNVRVWSTSSPPGPRTRQLGTASYELGTVAGQYVTGVAESGTPHLFDWRDGSGPTVLDGHGGPIRARSFSQARGLLATASADSTVRLWDLETGKQTAVLRHDEPVYRALFLNGGRRLLTETKPTTEARKAYQTAGTVHLWALDASAPTRMRAIDSTWGAKPMVDSTQFVVETGAVNDGERYPDSVIVDVRSAANGSLVARFGDENKIGVPYAQDSDGNHLVFRDDSVHYVASVRRGRVLGSIVRRETGGFQFGPGGQRLYFESIGEEGFPVLVYDVRTQKQVGRIPDPSSQIGRSSEGRFVGDMSPDGRLLTVDYFFRSPSTIQVLWERVGTDGNTYEPRKVFPRKQYSAVKFSPDGRFILTAAGEDASAHVHRIDRSGDSTAVQEVMTLPGHSDGVTEAEWLGDGSRILTRDQAGTLRVWPVYDTPQALVDTARALVERAHPTGKLTPQQREQFNLAP